MICLNTPTVVIGSFLLLNLLVGIYFSRKKTTFREYAVGNKQFSTATLVVTVLATLYSGGGMLRNLECIHDLGLWWIVIMVLPSFGFWVISRLSLRMDSFMQHLSIADTIGTIYGKYPRIITALVGVCGGIITITTQITAISKAISMCISLDNSHIILLFATFLIIFYSAYGGVRAVTYTDVLQFITFIIIIPLLTWFMFVETGNPVREIFPILHKHNKFQFSSVFSFNTQFTSVLLLILSCTVSYISPHIMHRVYMASGTTQARKVFSYSFFFKIIIGSFIILSAL